MCQVCYTVLYQDYLGEGLLSLLKARAATLEQLSLSCSSDPESAISLEPDGPAGQSGQLFNAGLLAVGTLAPAVQRLSLSGCGLVSQAAAEELRLSERLSSPSWLSRQTRQWFPALQSLILLSHEEAAQPAAPAHSGLLRAVLVAARQLNTLNIEGGFGSFFSDGYLSSVLASNPLSQLAVLDISVSEEGGLVAPGRVPLTVAAVRSVLASCGGIRELRISDWAVSAIQCCMSYCTALPAGERAGVRGVGAAGGVQQLGALHHPEAARAAAVTRAARPPSQRGHTAGRVKNIFQTIT